MAVSFGTPNNDLLVGTNEGDQIFGDAGNDGIFSLDGSDTVFGGDGVEILIGGGGGDFLFGEGDDDVIFGDSQIFGVGENDFISGGDGLDLIFGEAGDDTIRGDSGDDRLFGDAGNDELFGGDGADIVNGGEGDDTAFGGNDGDRFFADAGNDEVFGQNGNDVADGEEGDDLLNGGNDNDVLFGSLGNDTLEGGSGIDILVGSEDNDFLSGGNGDDVLIGVDPNIPAFGFGAGEIDTLSGGQGGDVFVIGDSGDVDLDNGTVVSVERGFPVVYYVGGGDSDYALITDFTLGQDAIALPDPETLPTEATEIGDAGQQASDAQVIAPGIESIAGEISPENDVDLFQITLEGGDFSASTIGGAEFDTQLFLFDENGNLIAGVDDSEGTLQTTLEVFGLEAGTYFLAISSFNNDPTFDSLFDGFTGDGFSSGTYTIELSGVEDASFSVGSSPEGLPPGTAISFGDDLVAIVQGVAPADLSLDSGNFVFV